MTGSAGPTSRLDHTLDHTMSGLTVFVPAFNEGDLLAGAIAAVRSNVVGLRLPFEIVIVDDGSTDRTGPIAEALAAEDSTVRVIHHERNRRIGAALKTAAAAARHEWVVLIPVDNPIPTEELHRLLEAATTACIAVGFRDGRPGYPGWMRLASRMYHDLLAVLFGMRLKDFNWCCLYRSDVLRSLPIRHDGILGLPEVLIRAHHRGHRLTEVPLSMRSRRPGNRRPTASRLRTMTTAFADALSLFWELRIRNRWTPGHPRLSAKETIR